MTDSSSSLLYLVRHGEAMPKDQDPDRPLTAGGADDVARMAAWAASAGICAKEIRHSGKLRAQQTAEIFAKHLPDAPAPQAATSLAPNDDVAEMASTIESEPGDTMLVGHLPFLERLASLLVAADASDSIVTLDAGALLALAKDEERGWYAVALVQPRLVPAS